MSRNKFEKIFDLKGFMQEHEIGFTENSTHFTLDKCPNCGASHNLNIDKKNKLWLCWSCVKTNQFNENKQGRGNLWTLLLMFGLDEAQIKDIYKNGQLLSYTGDFEIKALEDSHKTENDNYISDYEMPKYLIPLDRSSTQITGLFEVYKYLWDRNVRTPKQYTDFDLRYDFNKKRLVFPAITKDNICVGSQSRDITNRWKMDHPKCNNNYCDLRFKYYFVGEEEAPEECPECGEPLTKMFYPKSLNSRDFPKTEFFFNEQNIDWHKPVVLVEGPFDAINVDNSIAFLGKVLSDTQLTILLDNLKAPLILYLDGDKAGDFSTKAIYEAISPFFDIKIVYSESHEDPGMYDKSVNNEKVNTALKPSIWLDRKGFMCL